MPTHITALRAAAVATALLLGSWSAAEEMDVESVVAGRQANLRDLGAAYKSLNDELKRSSPTLPLLRQYSRQIDELARQQHFWFPAGSGPQPGIDTKAKAEIWTKIAQFDEARTSLEREAAKLLQVTASNDVAAIKARQRAVGKTCEGCHKQFREKED